MAELRSWSGAPFRRLRNVLHLGFLLFMRDFQYRFKQTYLGYTWAGLRPLLVGVPIILVGRQFNFGADEQIGISYPLFAFVGLTLWQVFWDALFYPQWIMRRTRKLLTRARFPYKAVLSAAGSYVLFNVMIYSVMIGIAVLIFGGTPGPGIVLGLLSLPMLILCGIAVGAFLAPMILVYLDLRYGLPMMSSVLMWTIPAVYVTPESGLLHTINTFNPITYLINTPRAWLTGATGGEVELFLLCFAGFMALATVSFWFYERTMRIAVDQIL